MRPHTLPALSAAAALLAAGLLTAAAPAGPNIGAQNIDLKEGTTGGLVSGNTFDGSGLSMTNYDELLGRCEGQRLHHHRQPRRPHPQRRLPDAHPAAGLGLRHGLPRQRLRPDRRDRRDRLAIDVTNYSASCPTTVYGSNTVTGGYGLTDIAVTP